MLREKLIWLATANKGKQKEIIGAIGESFLVQCFSDLNVEETGHTLQENALIKARAVFQATGENTLADDTGLEVDALNGAPGVYSARYAGEPANDQRNIEKLLKKLEGRENRSARFRTVMALIWNGKEYLFEGTVEGNILRSQVGNGGFGYDPVFMPVGKDITFAEMPIEEKNAISHRGRALAKVAAFLNRLP